MYVSDVLTFFGLCCVHTTFMAVHLVGLRCVHTTFMAVHLVGLHCGHTTFMAVHLATCLIVISDTTLCLN